MKRIAIAVCVVVLVFAVTSIAQTPAQPKSMSVEQQLMKLENGWNDAMVKRDVAFLDRILADDWMDGESDGTVTTKAQFLANIKSEDTLITSEVLNDYKVHVYGDAAVVLCHYTEVSTNKGKDTTGKYQDTDTWVKIAGNWRCVASNGSKVEKK
jgi:hypothetical protein